GGEGPALMRLALLSAFVLVTADVFDQRPTGAVRTASAKDGVERVECFSGELGNGELAEQWADVVSDIALIAFAGRHVDIEHIEVSVHELVDRRLRAWIASLVDLVQHPCAGLLRLTPRVRAGRDGLPEKMPASGERVLARVHLDAQRSAFQHLDLAALTLSGPASGRSHGMSVQHFAPPAAPRGYDWRSSLYYFSSSDTVPPAGFEPATHGLGNRCSIP